MRKSRTSGSARGRPSNGLVYSPHRVQVVRFCSFYKAVDHCAGFCSMIGLDQHEVLPSDRKGTDGPLRRLFKYQDKRRYAEDILSSSFVKECA